MKKLLFFCFFIFMTGYASVQGQGRNKISVTIDDLPLVGIGNYKPVEYVEIFNRLVNEIKNQNTWAVGFVIESRLETDGKRDVEKIKLLETWLNAGLFLGNHTYSHPSLNKISPEDYEKDIIKGELTLNELLSKRGMKIEYFRHPFLQTGLSIETRDRVNNFLKNRGYRIAPVTFDNSEWIFARAYEKAYNSSDEEKKKEIGSSYIEYMKEKLEYWESQSKALFGRNIAHVLLMHANRLNSEYYGKLCQMLREKNYDFVSLEETLKDEAYNSEDNFIRNAGISWIHRWAIAKKMKKDFYAGEPDCPAWVMKYAGVDSE